jgi:hypothetical protein
MLWHKTWLDTRIRFFAGFGLMTVAAVAIVMAFPRLRELAEGFPASGGRSGLGAQIEQAIQIARNFRGYEWTQWFSRTPSQLGTLFAVILGSGSLLSRGSEGTGLFTLSLPVSRARLVTTRAAVGAIELFIMAAVPSLLIPLTAPAVGESYAIGATVVHALCLFAGWILFFSLALFLSTVWDDLWKPMLLACGTAVCIAMAEILFNGVGRVGPFALMSGADFFFTGHVPWIGWVISAALSSAIVYAATVNFTNRDF